MKKVFALIIVIAIGFFLSLFENPLKDNIEKTNDKNYGQEISEGTYIGTGEGFAGPIKTRVTFKMTTNGEIIPTEITVLENEEIPEYWEKIEDKIIPQILTGTNKVIDAETGATKSAAGILEAIEDAKEKAKRRN